ncbi:MAG: outer membrane beta-barrel protein [Bacteroidales bacterium]|nr:outer membrane beta-barrel protein [Bacteroidales bacterium]
MRSILSQGEEDVPAHVWEGISSELDRIDGISRRKTVMLWFRRSAAAAAAAAAVAVGVFTDWNVNGDIVPATSDKGLIAVAESPEINAGYELSSPAAISERKLPSYLAYVPEEEAETVETVAVPAGPAEAPQKQEPAKEPQGTVSAGNEPAAETWPEIWEDDETEKIRKRRRTALTLSGIAGTNSVQSSGLGPMRRPSMSTSRPKTGVEQKSSESTYGLPVSLGAGVKIGLSDRWSLGVGANYTILTRKFFGTYTKVNQEGTIEESVSTDIRNAQQYVGIPVNAFYSIVDNEYMNFYTYAGVTVERCLSDKYDILNTEYIYKGTVKGVQTSANIGLGVEFMLGRHLGLYMDPSLRYYFDCGQPKSIRTAQPLMLGIEMGLRVNL